MDNDKTSISASTSNSQQSGTKTTNYKVPDLTILERRNWLIHLHYVRKDFQTCRTLIGEQLEESQGTCEYALYIKALILRDEGRVQESLDLFQTCCTLNGSVENLKQVARSFVLLGQHEDAVAVYEEASKLGELDWEICHNLGLCYMHLNDFEKARELFEQALKFRAHEQTLAALGELCLKEDDLKAALATYKQATDLSPENSDLNCKLGHLYIKSGYYQKAFEKLGTALAFDSKCIPAILAMGNIMQSHGDYEVALSKYRIAASKTPDSFTLWNNIGMCFYGKKKYVAAISCLKRAHYLSPLESKILHNLGLVHLTMQQYASAFHFLNAGAQLKPENGHIYMLLAMTLRHLQDFQNASQAYEKALEYEADDPLIPLNYGIYLYNQGIPDSAINQLKEFDERWQRMSKPLSKDVTSTVNKLAEALKMKDKVFQKRPTTAYNVLESPTEVEHQV